MFGLVVDGTAYLSKERDLMPVECNGLMIFI
jgi:hypothetical protein